jgi:hypothetical protein
LWVESDFKAPNLNYFDDNKVENIGDGTERMINILLEIIMIISYNK